LSPVYRLTTWLSHRLCLRCIFYLNIPAPGSILFSSEQSLSKKGKSLITPLLHPSNDAPLTLSSILQFPNQGQAWDDYKFNVHQCHTMVVPRWLIKPLYHREADVFACQQATAPNLIMQLQLHLIHRLTEIKYNGLDKQIIG
jgi:hypothetical protein